MKGTLAHVLPLVIIRPGYGSFAFVVPLSLSKAASLVNGKACPGPNIRYVVLLSILFTWSSYLAVGCANLSTMGTGFALTTPLLYVEEPLFKSGDSMFCLLNTGGVMLPRCWLHSAAPGKKANMALVSSMAKLVDISLAF